MTVSCLLDSVKRWLTVYTGTGRGNARPASAHLPTYLAHSGTHLHIMYCRLEMGLTHYPLAPSVNLVLITPEFSLLQIPINTFLIIPRVSWVYLFKCSYFEVL